MSPLGLLLALAGCCAAAEEAAAEDPAAARQDPTSEGQGPPLDGACDAEFSQCGGIAGTPALGWRSFQVLPDGYDLAKAISCGRVNSANAPSDNVVDFCTATRPPNGVQCEMYRTDLSVETRKECLYRCMFGTTDLNIYQVPNPGDPDAHVVVMMSPLSEIGYAMTPFLDNRSLPFSYNQCKFMVKFEQLRHLAEFGAKEKGVVAGKSVHFIFHLGHTGSTLLARALGEIGGTFILKEPPLLRQLAVGNAEATKARMSKLWQSLLLPWLSRRPKPSDTVIVKASSVSLHLMRTALKSAGAKVVFMYSKLRTHLTILHARPGDLFPEDLFEGLDVKDKVFRMFSLDDLSFGQKLALTWMKRMLFVLNLPQANVLHLDMDEFLAEPAKHLMAIGAHYGLTLGSETADAIVSSSVFTTYSKDASVKWNATTQKTMMEGRTATFGDSIEDGIAFARKLVKKYKTLRRLKQFLGE